MIRKPGWENPPHYGYTSGCMVINMQKIFFENNAIDYKETVSTINGTSIYERADMKEALQYNASGYPVKREVIQTSTGGTFTVYKEQYEYEEK